ncbi:MAG: type II secretion system protein E, partial [Bacteroidetes bacterium QS_9_68_14]
MAGGSDQSAPAKDPFAGGHRLAPRVPSPAFAKRFEAEVRAGSFDFEAPPSGARTDLGPLADAGLLPGLDRSGDSAGGYVLNEEPVANISDQWTGGDDGTAPASPGSSTETPPSADEHADVETSDRVVAFLLRSGIVEPRQVARAQQRREEQGSSEALWRVLARGRSVDRASVFAEAARVYAFPIADLEVQPPEPEFTRAVAGHFSEERRERMIELGLAPWRVEMDQERASFKLFLITHDPARPAVHRLAHELDVDRVELQYAPEEDVQALLADAFPQTNEYWDRLEDDDTGVDLGANYEEEDDLIDDEELEAEISRSKLINLFEATLVEAVREGASDIHIFPNPDKEVEIHFRTDGRLRPWHTERKVHPEALLAVIKDNSMNVDRFEKDAAQDGFIQRHVDGALIRFRVSIMPIASAAQDVRAESIVIRVLDDRKVITDLSELGLQERALDRFRHAINQPHGMVIMTGPTGSGKSTTLVAALHEVVSPEVNVLTVEDPVEYVIEDVRQIKLSHKLKLEDALRS